VLLSNEEKCPTIKCPKCGNVGNQEIRAGYPLICGKCNSTFWPPFYFSKSLGEIRMYPAPFHVWENIEGVWVRSKRS
jgi:hypothetical protein